MMPTMAWCLRPCIVCIGVDWESYTGCWTLNPHRRHTTAWLSRVYDHTSTAPPGVLRVKHMSYLLLILSIMTILIYLPDRWCYLCALLHLSVFVCASSGLLYPQNNLCLLHPYTLPPQVTSISSTWRHNNHHCPIRQLCMLLNPCLFLQWGP